MRAELKVMAKQSFLQEFELLKENLASKPSSGDYEDRDSAGRLDGEPSFFHDSMRTSPNGSVLGASANLQWSSPVAKTQRLRVPESPSSPPRNEASSRSSGLFILSTAPIQTSEFAIQKQISTSVAETTLSLIEQAHHFAEMNALFNMPSTLDERDPWFRHQLEEQNEQLETEHARQREAAKLQKKKLESSMETHRDRLEKARHPHRRFPLESKPSSALSSPRMKAYRTTPTSMDQSSTFGSTSIPSPSSVRDTTFPFPQSPPAQSAHPSSPAGQSRLQLTHPSTAPAPIHDTTTLDGASTSSQSLTGFGTISPSPGSPKTPNPAIAPHTATSPAPGSPHREGGGVATLREDEFLKRTETLDDTIKKMVRSVVNEELVKDCQQHHYTQRMQKCVVEKHENLLVKKIEASLGYKLKALREDIDKLKTTKLLKLQQDEEQWMATQDVSAVLGEDVTSTHVQTVTQEIKGVIQQALRAHFSKLLSDSRGGGNGMGDFDDASNGGNLGRPHARVHGSINTGASYPGGGHGGEGFDRDTAPAPSLMSSVVEEVIVKPKSKAERLLGMATDSKSGMPVNDPTASMTKFGISNAGGGGSGMWGGLGSLFSSKPGSSSNIGAGGATEFGKSAKPTMGSASTRSDSNPPMGLARMPTMDRIVDEEASEERKGMMLPPRQSSMRPFETESSSPAAASSTKLAQGGQSTPANGLAAELSAEETVYRDLMANLVTLAEVKVRLHPSDGWHGRLHASNTLPHSHLFACLVEQCQEGA